MVRVLLSGLLLLALSALADDEAYFKDMAFDAGTSARFVPANDSRLPAAVRTSARSVKYFSGLDLDFGTAFLLQDNTTFATARVHILKQPPIDFLQKLNESEARLGSASARPLEASRQALRVIKGDVPLFLTNPLGSRNDNARPTIIYQNVGGDNRAKFTFYLDPQGLALFRRFTKTNAENADVALYARTDFALIRLVKKMAATPLKLTSKRPAVGSAIYLIGFHGRPIAAPDYHLYVSPGKVLAVKDGVIWHNAYTGDETVGNGSKGSAIVNDKGEVVGIHTLEVKLANGKVVRGGPSASAILEYRRQFPELVKELEKQN
jgi:hypothetical protein